MSVWWNGWICKIQHVLQEENAFGSRASSRTLSPEDKICSSARCRLIYDQRICCRSVEIRNSRNREVVSLWPRPKSSQDPLRESEKVGEVLMASKASQTTSRQEQDPFWFWMCPYEHGWIKSHKTYFLRKPNQPHQCPRSSFLDPYPNRFAPSWNGPLITGWKLTIATSRRSSCPHLWHLGDAVGHVTTLGSCNW